jgi:hypothetical protein
MSDQFEDESPPRPSEGVRILGAEEAQAALEAREPQPPDSPPESERDERRLDDDDAAEAIVSEADPTATAEVPVAHDADLEVDLEGPRRPSRFPDEGPSWSASAAGESPAAADRPSGEVPPLPHWTEPPTGAVPAIFADSDDADDLDAWAASGAATPRFRAEGADWADADFVEDDLTDETGPVGALSEAAVVDEDEEFARDLEARRRTPRGRHRRNPAGPGPRRRNPISISATVARPAATSLPRSSPRVSSSSSRCCVSAGARSPRRCWCR